MDLGHPLVIPANEAVEDLGQEPALLAPKPPHDAEIDRDDAPLLVDEEIALMHVRVEESVAQRGAQEGLNQGAGQRGGIKSEVGQTARIGQRDPVDPFHRHHFARGPVPVDRRRADLRIIAGIFGEFRRRRGFEPEIHLHAHRAGEGLDNLGKPQAAKLRRQALSEARGEQHVGEVARKSPFGAGAQHFHRDCPHAFVSFHFSAMDLGDRSRGDRLAETLEQRFDLHPERGLDDGDRRLAAHWRDPVLQPLELNGDLAANDVWTRREELSRV